MIVSFGGLNSKVGGVHPFEFLNFISSTYKDVDAVFYRDQKQAWYHDGIHGLSDNITTTADHLSRLVKNYDKVIFLGVSAGGYAAILFGSLCNVDHVLSFTPQTLLDDRCHAKLSGYKDLKRVINSTTKYLVYGDMKGVGKHAFRHCANVDCFPNVKVIRMENVVLKVLRDSGALKGLIDERLY